MEPLDKPRQVGQLMPVTRARNFPAKKQQHKRPEQEEQQEPVSERPDDGKTGRLVDVYT
jgi:hypothetical protein